MTRSLSPSCTLPVGDAATTAVSWRLRGELRVTVIAKATFAFASEAPMARVRPLPIFEAEVHHAKNPLRSIRYTSDLVPYRKRADVFFTGSAYAPSGGTVDSLTVRFGVASGGQVLLDKRLVVRKKGGFKRIPLLYEHAVGGLGHPQNPLGQDAGFDGCNVLDPADPARAAGFGPLARAIAARRRLLGGSPFLELGRSPVQIPDGFDFDYFQAAPSDQQISFLRGDEWILLENMHPRHAVLRMLLPGARAVARIHGLSELGIPEGRPLAMTADTLHVNGDEETCTVAWRGTFPVAKDDALGAVRVVAGVELPGAPIVWPDAAELARAFAVSAAAPEPRGSAASNAETLSISDEATRPSALPFVASSLGAASIIAASTSSRPRSVPRPASTGDTLDISPGDADAAEPLPFATPQPPAISHDPAGPAPPAPQVEEAPPPPKSKEEIWGPVAAAPPAKAEGRPATKPPPRVDVMNKLYGAWQKG